MWWQWWLYTNLQPPSPFPLPFLALWNRGQKKNPVLTPFWVSEKGRSKAWHGQREDRLWELCGWFMHVALVKEDLKTHSLHKIIWYLFALKHKNQIVVIVYNNKCFINTLQWLPNDTEIIWEKIKKREKHAFFILDTFYNNFLGSTAVFPYRGFVSLCILRTHQIYFSALLTVDTPCLLRAPETKNNRSTDNIHTVLLQWNNKRKKIGY